MSQAVIKTGGKQYFVKPGTVLKVEKLLGKENDTVKFDTLLVTDEKGDNVELGMPLVKSKVEGKIVKHGRADKILVVKYKAKVRYHRRVGHRQQFTQIKIEKI